jgi:hypothetical protein
LYDVVVVIFFLGRVDMEIHEVVRRGRVAWKSSGPIFFSSFLLFFLAYVWLYQSNLLEMRVPVAKATGSVLRATFPL